MEEALQRDGVYNTATVKDEDVLRGERVNVIRLYADREVLLRK